MIPRDIYARSRFVWSDGYVDYRRVPVCHHYRRASIDRDDREIKHSFNDDGSKPECPSFDLVTFERIARYDYRCRPIRLWVEMSAPPSPRQPPLPLGDA